MIAYPLFYPKNMYFICFDYESDKKDFINITSVL